MLSTENATSQPNRSGRVPLGFAVAGLLLYIWWAIPGLTEGIDLAAFHMFNGLVGISPALDRVWAATNLRYFDAATMIIYASLALRWLFCDGRGFARRRGAELFAALLVLLVVRSGYDELLDRSEYARASPSIVVKDARIITDYVPKTKAKYRSKFSFPGDHALVSTWVLVHMALNARRGYASAALALTVTSGLPRLVVGGHWITDNTVGGLGTALLAQGLLAWCGILPWLSDCSERVCLWLERALGIKWLGDPGSPT